MKSMNDGLKINLGLQRLFFFTLTFFMTVHIFSCLWLICASMYDQSDDGSFEGTWLQGFAEEYKQDAKKALEEGSDISGWKEVNFYLISVYWTVTTITTVGYGDISGTNNVERMFAAVTMIGGVIAFSFATGTLSSLLANFDNQNAKQSERMG
jgi:hypothetical protein